MKYFAAALAVLFVLILAITSVTSILSDLSPPEISAQAQESIRDAEINETFSRPIASDVMFDVYSITLSAPDITQATDGIFLLNYSNTGTNIYFYWLCVQDENIIRHTSNPANFYDPVRTYSVSNRHYATGTECVNQMDKFSSHRFPEIENLRVFNDRTVILTAC